MVSFLVMTNIEIFKSRLAMWQRLLYNEKVGVNINETETSDYHDNVFAFDRHVGIEEEQTENNDYYGYSELINYKNLYQNQKERFMLKYKRFIEINYIKTKKFTPAQIQQIKAKTEIIKDNKYILYAAFYLNDSNSIYERVKDKKIEISPYRKVNVYVEKNTNNKYEIKEVAFQEDRQKVINYIQTEALNEGLKDFDIKTRKFKLIFLNKKFEGEHRLSSITNPNMMIDVTFTEIEFIGNYLFNNSSNNLILLDKKILNMLCPFKILYEYKKLKLEPPLYWSYRYQRVLSNTTKEYGRFQLALSRMQNKWCQGNSIFNTILLMRYFMSSWYILADEKPLKQQNSNTKQLFADINNMFNAAAAYLNIDIEEQQDKIKNRNNYYKNLLDPVNGNTYLDRRRSSSRQAINQIFKTNIEFTLTNETMVRELVKDTNDTIDITETQNTKIQNVFNQILSTDNIRKEIQLENIGFFDKDQETNTYFIFNSVKGSLNLDDDEKELIQAILSDDNEAALTDDQENFKQALIKKLSDQLKKNDIIINKFNLDLLSVFNLIDNKIKDLIKNNFFRTTINYDQNEIENEIEKGIETNRNNMTNVKLVKQKLEWLDTFYNRYTNFTESHIYTKSITELKDEIDTYLEGNDSNDNKNINPLVTDVYIELFTMFFYMCKNPNTEITLGVNDEDADNIISKSLKQNDNDKYVFKYIFSQEYDALEEFIKKNKNRQWHTNELVYLDDDDISRLTNSSEYVYKIESKVFEELDNMYNEDEAKTYKKVNNYLRQSRDELATRIKFYKTIAYFKIIRDCLWFLCEVGAKDETIDIVFKIYLEIIDENSNLYQKIDKLSEMKNELEQEDFIKEQQKVMRIEIETLAAKVLVNSFENLTPQYDKVKSDIQKEMNEYIQTLNNEVIWSKLYDIAFDFKDHIFMMYTNTNKAKDSFVNTIIYLLVNREKYKGKWQEETTPILGQPSCPVDYVEGDIVKYRSVYYVLKEKGGNACKTNPKKNQQNWEKITSTTGIPENIYQNIAKYEPIVISWLKYKFDDKYNKFEEYSKKYYNAIFWQDYVESNKLDAKTQYKQNYNSTKNIKLMDTNVTTGFKYISQVEMDRFYKLSSTAAVSPNFNTDYVTYKNYIIGEKISQVKKNNKDELKEYFEYNDAVGNLINTTVVDIDDSANDSEDEEEGQKETEYFNMDLNFQQNAKLVIKELEHLFISASVRTSTVSSSVDQSYKNYLSYLKTSPNTIENMLNGYIEYLSHGIDLNTENNIKAFYAQTFKQFFQNMAKKINKQRKENQSEENEIQKREQDRQFIIETFKNLILKFYSFEPYYKKYQEGFLCQSKEYEDVNKTSLIAFAHAMETYETSSLTYPADVVHYQQYKIQKIEEMNNRLVTITSGQEYIYLKVDNPSTYKQKIVNFRTRIDDNIKGYGLVTNTVIENEYIEIRIYYGYCPYLGKLVIDVTNQIDITFDMWYKKQHSKFVEDKRTIKEVILQSINPYQVFLTSDTSIVHPNEKSQDVKYFHVELKNKGFTIDADSFLLFGDGRTLEQGLLKFETMELKPMKKNTLLSDFDFNKEFSQITEHTNPYVIYFCNYLFMTNKNSFRYGTDFFPKKLYIDFGISRDSGTWGNIRQRWEEVKYFNDIDIENEFLTRIGNKSNELNDNNDTKIDRLKFKTDSTIEMFALEFDNLRAKYKKIENATKIKFDSDLINTITSDVPSTYKGVNSIIDKETRKSVILKVDIRMDTENDYPDLQSLQIFATWLHNLDLNNGVNMYENKENIEYPFRVTMLNTYFIEYGTYEFVHHLFKGNLAKRNIYVKKKTGDYIVFQNDDFKYQQVLPMYNVYEVPEEFLAPTTSNYLVNPTFYKTMQDEIFKKSKNRLFWRMLENSKTLRKGKTAIDNLLNDFFGYYETTDLDISQQPDSNLNSYVKEPRDEEPRDEEPRDSSRYLSQYYNMNDFDTNYAAIRFDYKKDTNTEISTANTTFLNDDIGKCYCDQFKVNGIESNVKMKTVEMYKTLDDTQNVFYKKVDEDDTKTRSHYGQFATQKDENTLFTVDANGNIEASGKKWNLIVFYRNRALQYFPNQLSRSKHVINICYKKNDTYVTSTNVNNITLNEKVYVRNLILETKNINELLLNNENNDNKYTYCCFYIPKEHFCKLKIDQNNFTHDSSFLKYVIPVIYQLKCNMYYNDADAEEEMTKYEAKLDKLQNFSEFDQAIKRYNSYSTVGSFNTKEKNTNYLKNMFENMLQLEEFNIQYRQALRKMQIRYMDFCDYELFYNVFLAETVEDETNLQIDIEELTSISSGNIKDRWSFFVRLALYEKYNYFLPILQKNVNTPTFERFFKTKAILNVNNPEKLDYIRHGVFEQWVYIYCLGLTVLLCE